jgi:hypothetical protein
MLVLVRLSVRQTLACREGGPRTRSTKHPFSWPTRYSPTYSPWSNILVRQQVFFSYLSHSSPLPLNNVRDSASSPGGGNPLHRGRYLRHRWHSLVATAIHRPARYRSVRQHVTPTGSRFRAAEPEEPAFRLARTSRPAIMMDSPSQTDNKELTMQPITTVESLQGPHLPNFPPKTRAHPERPLRAYDHLVLELPRRL